MFFKIFSALYSAYFIFIFVMTFVIHYILDTLLLQFLKDRNAENYWWAARFLKAGVFLTGLKIKIDGLENVPKSGPLIMVCNHQSLLDILIVFITSPRRLTFILKKELTKVWFLGHDIRMQQHIQVDRSDAKGAAKILADLETELYDDRTLFFFPEGTRSLDGKIAPYKRGAFQIAVKTGTTIQPLAVDGAIDVLSKKSLWVSPGTITMRFAEPIKVEKQTDDVAVKKASKVLTQQVQEITESLID